ncbi:MAG: cytochrome c oxidase assembly protein [Acidobacteriota bacterium]
MSYAILGGFRPSRALAWILSGVLFLAIVVCSPLDLLARQYLFTAEAVEQVLIGLVVAHLLVRGTPEKAVRRLRVDRLPLSPYFTWVAGAIALSVWYIPRLLNATLDSDAVRCVQYLTLLVGGALFWWPLHSPIQKQRIPLVPHTLLYLAAAAVWCSLIGLFIAFGQTWSSAHYLTSPDVLNIADSLVYDWGLTRETDQETAGLVFWISAGTILLTKVMFVYYRWYCSAEVEGHFRASVGTIAVAEK